MRGRGARILLPVIAALVFGILASVAKGNGAGIRDGIGNLSAPWVGVPLLASAFGSRGRMALGAVLGLLATGAALIGFYLGNAFVLDLGPHSTIHDIALTLNVGNVWFKAGLVSGPVMGAIGAWAARRSGFTVAAIAVASIVLEPVAVYLAYLGSNGLFAAGNGQWNDVYAGEAATGFAAAIVLWRLRHSDPPASLRSALLPRSIAERFRSR